MPGQMGSSGNSGPKSFSVPAFVSPPGLSRTEHAGGYVRRFRDAALERAARHDGPRHPVSGLADSRPAPILRNLHSTPYTGLWSECVARRVSFAGATGPADEGARPDLPPARPARWDHG